jgi:hypothetical protein
MEYSASYEDYLDPTGDEPVVVLTRDDVYELCAALHAVDVKQDTVLASAVCQIEAGRQSSIPTELTLDEADEARLYLDGDEEFGRKLGSFPALLAAYGKLRVADVALAA